MQGLPVLRLMCATALESADLLSNGTWVDVMAFKNSLGFLAQ